MRTITWFGNKYVILSSITLPNKVIMKEISEYNLNDAMFRLFRGDDKVTWEFGRVKAEIRSRIYAYIGVHFECPEYIKQELSDKELPFYWRYMNGPIEKEYWQISGDGQLPFIIGEKSDSGKPIISTIFTIPCGKINEEDNTGTSIHLKISISEPFEDSLKIWRWIDSRWVKTDDSVIADIAEEKIRAAKFNKRRFIEW